MHPRNKSENLEMLRVLGPVRKAMFVYTNYVHRGNSNDATADRLRAELAEAIATADAAIKMTGCG